MVRSFRKYAAVGRKEMYIMFGYLFVASVLQIIMSAGVAGQGKGGKVSVQQVTMTSRKLILKIIYMEDIRYWLLFKPDLPSPLSGPYC